MQLLDELVENELKTFDNDKLKILDEFWSEVQLHKKDLLTKWGVEFTSLSGPCVKVKIQNGKVTLIERNHLKDKIKPERLNNTIDFLNQCCSSIKQLYLYINLTDTGTDLNNYPVLVYSKCKSSSNILIPDPYFLYNYDKWHRLIPNTSLNEELNNAMSKSAPFEQKRNIFMCRIQHNKFKSLNDITKGLDNVNVKCGYMRDKTHWVSLDDQLNNKYLITHPNRWDTIYKYVKSNSLILMFTTDANAYSWQNKILIWLTLFLKPYEHYLPFSNREDFIECMNFCEKRPLEVKNIIKRASDISEKYYTIQQAVNFGRILLEKIENKQKNYKL